MSLRVDLFADFALAIVGGGSGMGKIIRFPIELTKRRSADPETLRAQGGARVLLFTGVFYSRLEEDHCLELDGQSRDGPVRMRNAD